MGRVRAGPRLGSGEFNVCEGVGIRWEECVQVLGGVLEDLMCRVQR